LTERQPSGVIRPEPVTVNEATRCRVYWNGLRGQTLARRSRVEAFEVCTSTIYKLCAQGKLAPVRVSNAIRIAQGVLVAARAATE
jgi:hypothetical protein